MADVSGGLRVARDIAAFAGLRAESVAALDAGLESRVRVGFVPTLGNLHRGHLSLIGEMVQQCDISVVSIFVNPLQFAAGEDLAKYPRTLEADLRLCRDAGADIVFLPAADELYPPGFEARVSLPGLASRWCGASRPGHFDGVATVVLKLFQIVQPCAAYFGEKDFQQLRIIQQLTADLNLGVSIVPCSTVRETDGLALSSRNGYLAEHERRLAPLLHDALARVQELYWEGESSAELLLNEVRRMFDDAGRTSGTALRLDYAGIADPATLEPRQTVGAGDRALIAAWIGGTRLIDNIALAREPDYSYSGMTAQAARALAPERGTPQQ